MKKLFAGILLALGAITAFTQEALPIGATLPKAALKMKDVSGELVTLNAARRSNGLLVMFSCNTCPYVRKNQARTLEICGYAETNNIGVIILNSNEATRQAGESFADMQAYARDQGYKWLYAMDSHNELADAFGAKRTPECYLFDASGKLVYHGAIDDSPADESSITRAHLKEAINEVTTGKGVTIKESRSVGCTIQRRG